MSEFCQRPRSQRGWITVLTVVLLTCAFNTGCFWIQSVSTANERHSTETRDGWKLAMHRYKPEQLSVEKEPVLLVHGFASNRFTWSLSSDRSFATYLLEKGYDVWVAELRGSGESDGSAVFTDRKADYNFDTYMKVDLPALITYIRYTTQRDNLTYIGHSLGAMLGYAYLSTNPDGGGVKNLVALSGPSNFKDRNSAIDFIMKVKGLFMVTPKIYAELAAKAAANNLGWTDTRFDALLWNNEAINPRAISMVAYNSVSNFPTTLLEQASDWVSTGEFRSADKLLNYEELLQQIEIPCFVGTGKVDAIATPRAVKTAFDKIGSKDKELRVFGTANGFAVDYGHLDLVMGDKVALEVFPTVFTWLENH